jgi:hypothetical protein
MADARWREAERRWRADGDAQALSAAIAGRRREGLAVPASLLDAQVFSPTTFESRVPFVVEVERPDGSVDRVGCTPSKQPLKVPRHRAWWACATRDPWRSYGKLPGVERVPFPDSAPGSGQCLGATALGRVLAEVEAKRVPGFALRAHSLADVLERLPVHLETLDLERSFSRGGLGPLARLMRLRRLVLGGMGRVDLRPLRDLPELVTLELAANQGLQLDDVPRSTARLGLSLVGGVDSVLDGIVRLPALTHLDVSCRDLTDVGAKQVARCPGLLSLNLASSQLTDKGLRALARALPKLEALTLDRCDGLTDKGVAALSGLTSLRTLSLDHCRGLTAKGLAQLSSLSNLRALYLRATGKLMGDRTAARERLREALTGCKIY